ncbi:MAG: carbohydrate ABC transporter permease [Treponema sp.]|nr:carbohydrate ABC transporter permease [Treponema sp.]
MANTVKQEKLSNRQIKLAKHNKDNLQSKGDNWFYFLIDFLLFFALVLVLYPLIYVFSASFSSPSAVMSNKVFLWPVDVSLAGYQAVLKESRVWIGYANTIFYTVIGTTINLVLTVMCAYPLSRKDFIGRNIFMFIVTFTMIFSGGMLPTYIVIRQLGMMNTRWAMLLPGAIAAYNVIIARTYYQTNISDELLEAAFIDGCSNIRFILRVVIPLSAPITAVLILFFAVDQWNAYFNAFIYLSNRNIFPLQIFLREILVMNQITSDMLYDPQIAAAKQGLSDLLKYSLIIVASAPIWCAYPFVQKYFVKGIMIGAIKG